MIYRLIPESPRWLIATGQSEAAAGILKNAAKVNRLSRTDIDNVLACEPKTTNSNKPAGFWGLFRTPNLRRTSLSLFFNWFITGMSAFGFTQYMSSIGESNDIFINFAVSLKNNDLSCKFFCVVLVGRTGNVTWNTPLHLCCKPIRTKKQYRLGRPDLWNRLRFGSTGPGRSFPT